MVHGWCRKVKEEKSERGGGRRVLLFKLRLCGGVVLNGSSCVVWERQRWAAVSCGWLCCYCAAGASDKKKENVCD